MKRSKIQLLQTTLLKVSVEPVMDSKFKDRRASNPFEYENIELETSKSCKAFPRYWDDIPLPAEGLGDKTYYAQLGIRTPQDSDDVGPYRFEIVCGAVIVILPERKPLKISDPDLALQYGLTLLYEVIREQLATLTYRMSWGQALLPTMTFLDEVTLDALQISLPIVSPLDGIGLSSPGLSENSDS